MNQYHPDFPADFLLKYLEDDEEEGLQRFQTYVIFRIFTTLEKKECSLASTLKTQMNLSLTEDDFSTISNYLQDDFFFSPSFADNSNDLLFLYYAIHIAADKNGTGSMLLDRLLSKYCPQALKASYDDASFALDFVYEDELAFWAALYICLSSYETELPSLLPEFSRIYWDDLHFTVADFVLYDFFDEYFEVKNCLRREDFKELIDTLVLATLRSFQTDLEQFTMDALFQIKHPSASLAGIYRFGALDMHALPTLDVASQMMQKILEYAVAYELRTNLYDYHLDEDKTITLTNWKENLKWHYVQYTNVHNLALSSFHSAFLSQKLLKVQWNQNIQD